MFAAIAIIVIIIGILGYAATKPDHFRYERSAVIKATPEKIFPYLNNTRKASEWSPWEKKDPDMKRIYSGPEEGVGAKFAWNGNREVGAGSTEIVESVPNDKIVMNLDFIKPFEGHNKAEYILTPQGEATRVAWVMYGPNPFIGKLVNVFVNCEKMVGREFEKGLSDLKMLMEK